MGVVLENYKKQQFAEGRELGHEEGREEGRAEVIKEMAGRIATLEAQLSEVNGKESCAQAVASAVEPETANGDETREGMLKRIAALEKAVVQLLASRPSSDNQD